MKSILLIIFTILLFQGCSKEPKSSKNVIFKKTTTKSNTTINKVSDSRKESHKVNLVLKDEAKVMFETLPNTYLQKSDFSKLPNWQDEDYDEALSGFLNSCRSDLTRKIYKQICLDAKDAKSAKIFLQQKFNPYKIDTKDGEKEGLLTGYYEPLLRGSLVKTSVYKYPIHATPKDLIIVDLSSIYPDLANYRLRGKLQGNKLVPYPTRKESSSKHIPAQTICYTDSKIDLFFLEIQGSGRVKLTNGETIFIGYDNQNGHNYRAIGRYLVDIGVIDIEEVSLQSIRTWLKQNPSRIDEVLNYNDSVVYFKQKENSATGSLGLPLTPKRSVAVDRRYIPLGSLLYLSAQIKDESINKIVLAQDTGGAIKGAIRADLFLGYGKEAMNIAGELKSPLKLWILLPKNQKDLDI